MLSTGYVFDQQIAMLWLQRLGMALLILGVTWLLARAAHWAFAKLVDKVAILKRGTSTGKSLGASLGHIVGLLIWLFGLVAVLQVFNLGGVMAPVQTLLNSVMAFLPRLLGAGLIFFLGLMVARIVRDLIVTALETVDLDKWAMRGGMETTSSNNTISKTLGTIAYILIIIPVAILALDTLNLQSVSAPASDMLRLIFDAIPRIIGAAIVLGLGYVISKFVVEILGGLLPGLGIDRSVGSLNVLPAGTSASNIVARVAQVAIMLFAAIAATRLLGFPDLTAILDQILKLGGRVAFGAVVIFAGFLFANMLARIIAGEGQNSLAATVVRWAGIILFTFMGLQFMGVGEDIVRLAFGALVIGAAVAAALAFGLGGRDAAAKMLDQMRDKLPEAPPAPRVSPPVATPPMPPQANDTAV